MVRIRSQAAPPSRRQARIAFASRLSPRRRYCCSRPGHHFSIGTPACRDGPSGADGAGEPDSGGRPRGAERAPAPLRSTLAVAREPFVRRRPPGWSPLRRRTPRRRGAGERRDRTGERSPRRAAFAFVRRPSSRRLPHPRPHVHPPAPQRATAGELGVRRSAPTARFPATACRAATAWWARHGRKPTGCRSRVGEPIARSSDAVSAPRASLIRRRGLGGGCHSATSR